jgi:Lrp/AsnC family leucine-responsive transcriptional regulator
MDATDRKIIRELQINARLTNNDLAERINLSPSPCLRRVRNLEQQGVIEGYTAVIDQEKYGLAINAFVLIRLEKQTDTLIDEFEARIQEIDEVMECYVMTGSSDYFLHIVSDSLRSYEKFMKQRLTKVPGIGSIETSFAFGKIKKTSTFPPLSHFEEDFV